MENQSENLNQVPEFKLDNGFKLFPFFKTSQAAFFIFSLAIIFYSPSFNNEYALDDGIVIHQNSYVLKGVRGITDLLTKDTYDSFYRRMNAHDQLSGGRYRPLPSITYAIEQEIIGPYRSGLYMQVTDLNRNGILDSEPITYNGPSGKFESNYEYNDFVDQNNDGMAQPSECFYCWDLNKNFKNDLEEDLNQDGIFNEVDCQTYGAKLRHFVNIVLYAFCCLLFFQVLSKLIFSDKKDLAFLSALLFTIHPVHSEVVANVRGRDDLLSMLFILLTISHVLRFIDQYGRRHLVYAGIFSFLALMSKEYALLLIVLIPVLLYFFRPQSISVRQTILPIGGFIVGIVLMGFIDFRHLYFTDSQLLNFIVLAIFLIASLLAVFRKQIMNGNGMLSTFVVGCCTLLYVAFRLSAVNIAPSVPDTEILNNPFLFASGEEALATKVYMLMKGLYLQLWPGTLVADYSFKSIPYLSFSSTEFIVSALLHLCLLILAIVFTLRRHLLGFALITYLLFMVVISNLFFPTSIMFLESHLFHASLAFCIVLAYLITNGLTLLSLSKPGAARSSLLLLCMLLILLGCAKSWERSKDWKNDVTLFLKDVNNAPHSVLVLGNAGARWIDLADTREITGISISGQENTPLNTYNGTLVITDEELQLSGMKTKRESALKKGINFLEHAVELHPKYVNGMLNLGLAYYKLADDHKTILYWKLAERLYPNNPYLNNYYQVYSSNLRDRGMKAFMAGDTKKALIAFNKWTLLQPEEAEAWYQKAGAYYNLGWKHEAFLSYCRAVDLQPFNTTYTETMQKLGFKYTAPEKKVSKKDADKPC